MSVGVPLCNALWFRTLWKLGAVRRSCECSSDEIEDARTTGRLIEDDMGYWYVEPEP